MTDPNLENRITKLEKAMMDLHSGNTIPIWLDQALQGRGFTKLNAKQLKAITSLPSGVSGTYYVSLTSGGAVSHLIAFTNGILTTA